MDNTVVLHGAKPKQTPPVSKVPQPVLGPLNARLASRTIQVVDPGFELARAPLSCAVFDRIHHIHANFRECTSTVFSLEVIIHEGSRALLRLS